MPILPRRTSDEGVTMTGNLDRAIRRWAPRAYLVRITPVTVTMTGRRLFSVDVRDSRGRSLGGSELVWGSRVLLSNAITQHYPSARWDCAHEYRLGGGGAAGVLMPATLDVVCAGCGRLDQLASTATPSPYSCRECARLLDPNGPAEVPMPS